MSSREKILAAVRANMPEKIARPDFAFEKLTFDDPVSRFRELVESVGGLTHIVKGGEDLQALAEIPDDARVISSIEGITDKNINRDDIKSGHDMKDIDYCCFHVDQAVAENGAILSHCTDFPHRSVYFLAQHVIVTVDASAIKHNMHEAYKELKEMDMSEFTVFISGPSKTADIEQCLVIGAHGARSMQIFIKE